MKTWWPKCSSAISTKGIIVSDIFFCIIFLLLVLQILDYNGCVWLVKLSSFFMDGNLHVLFFAKSSSFPPLTCRPTSGSLLDPSLLQLAKNTVTYVAWLYLGIILNIECRFWQKHWMIDKQDGNVLFTPLLWLVCQLLCEHMCFFVVYHIWNNWHGIQKKVWYKRVWFSDVFRSMEPSKNYAIWCCCCHLYG